MVWLLAIVAVVAIYALPRVTTAVPAPLIAIVFLLVVVVALGGVVGRIPMAALVGVMVVVSASTFDWSTIRPATLRTAAWSDTAVMALTVVVIAVTRNLAFGVIGGVLCARLVQRHARAPAVVAAD